MIVLVIGLRRSGTSLVAHLLHEMGVVMGERWLETVEEYNPAGNFEDHDFVLAQQPIQSNVKFDAHGRISECDRAAYAAWQSLILQRCARYPRWGIKNFGLPFLLMELAAVAPDRDIRLIVCRRRFNKCILSWLRMAPPNLTLAQMIEKSAAFLFNLEQAADTWIRHGGKILEVDYEALVRNPHTEVAALAAYCGLDVPPGLEKIVNVRFKHF